MKNRIILNILPFILITGILFSGCKKEEDISVPKVIPQASEVNSFIWNGLHEVYLWKGQVPALADSKYNKLDSVNALLNHYTDPQKLFKSLLYKPGTGKGTVDHWSFLVDNSKDIDDWINGISETMGFDFMLSYIREDSHDIFGFVRYVQKGSPAEKAGVKRGDLFMKINDQQLTDANYEELLFTNISYKLTFATFTGNDIIPENRSVTMTAVEMQENPIHKDTVFAVNNQKVGYFVYNGFNADFDFDVNDVFARFKAENINQLVVDLRYNGGGSVQSAIYLASMIYGTDKSKVFAQAKYNDEWQKLIIKQEGADALKNYFVNSIEPTSAHPTASINTLNLRKVYFLVSDNTASASELLINGLKPYMDVKVVGDSTVGKYTGSITIKDEDSAGHPISTWAMQPIVVKFANSLGISDFYEGLFPDIYVEESVVHLMPLGDPNETLLKAALDDMQGIAVTSQALKSAKLGFKKFKDSQQLKRFGTEMYINPGTFNNLKKERE